MNLTDKHSQKKHFKNLACVFWFMLKCAIIICRVFKKLVLQSQQFSKLLEYSNGLLLL